MGTKKDFTQSLGKRARPKASKAFNFHKPFEDPKPSNVDEAVIEVEENPLQQHTEQDSKATNPTSDLNVRAQNGHKTGTVRSQFGHKTDTIRSQMVTSTATNESQLVTNSTTKRSQNGHNSVTNSTTNSVTKPHSRSQDFNHSQKKQFARTRGNSRKILTLIYKICKQTCNPVTYDLSRDDISELCDVKPNSVKNTVERLVSEGLLERVHFYKGPKGGTIFRLPDDVYKEISEVEEKGLLDIPSHKMFMRTNSATNSATTDNVVSSSNINTSTYIHKELDEIDISPLEKYGFKKGHLIQIDKAYKKDPSCMLDIDVIQESINAMAYDLKNTDARKSFKNEPVVMLTAMLKKGSPYTSTSPETYKTPEQEAMENYLAAKRAQQEKEKQQAEELRELELNEWIDQLTETEINEILGDKLNTLTGSAGLKERAKRGYLAEYFTEEIWPEKYQKIKQAVLAG